MNEIELLRKIVSHIDKVQVAPGILTSSHLEALPFVRAKFSTSGEFVGIRREAGGALYDLADAIFTKSIVYRRGAAFNALFNELCDIIIEFFYGRPDDKIDTCDFAYVEARIENWFRANAAEHRLYVPCILSPRPAASFTIGPISFRHVGEFAAHERSSVGELFDDVFDRLFQEMAQVSAGWMATVEVHFATRERAWELGELGVDIALAGIQLVIPLAHSQNMARMTARTIPRLRSTVSFSDGGISAGGSNQQPGLAMAPGRFEGYVSEGDAILRAVGHRIAFFLSGESGAPNLEQAWADAAYWYHEGLAEPLDTIAVAKLETAIEVMLRSENSRGSGTAAASCHLCLLWTEARPVHQSRFDYHRERVCEGICPR